MLVNYNNTEHPFMNQHFEGFLNSQAMAEYAGVSGRDALAP